VRERVCEREREAERKRKRQRGRGRLHKLPEILSALEVRHGVASSSRLLKIMSLLQKSPIEKTIFRKRDL